MNCSLDFIHYMTREQESYIDFHRHNTFEIVYYETGEGYTHINGQKYEYGPNSFSVIYPNCWHDEFRITESNVIFIGFQYGNEPVSLRNGVYLDDNRQSIRKLLQQMVMEMNSKQSYYMMKLDLVLKETIIEIHRIVENVAMNGLEEKLLYAKKYIEQYYCQKINVHQLAEVTGYSYDHFRHLYKQYTGLSPMNFIMMKRLEKAKKLLLESKNPVTSVAMECGFSNTPQFSMIFKKINGHSPKDFRKNAEYNSVNRSEFKSGGQTGT